MHPFLFLFAVIGLAWKGDAQEGDAPTAMPSEPPTEQWSGCVLPNRSSRVKIGDPTPICLTIGPDGSWSRGVPYLRWMFTPKADEYSRFRIPNSYMDLVGNPVSELDGNLTVHTASHSQLSWLRLFHDKLNDRVYPFLTAIVDVDNGVVQGIAWDNACVFCDSGRCLENTFDFDGNAADEETSGAPSKGCYLDSSECTAIENGSDIACDVQIYVVWTGTDSDGIAMQSSANRFSNFSPAKLQDRASSLLPNVPGF